MSYAPVCPLRPGETIAVVAPAGPVPDGSLRAGLDRLAADFRLQVASDIHRVEGFFAGSDARRAEELNAALRDPDVRAIWVARGGYGSSRILPDLDAAALRADPIPIVGFSDATALLVWVARQGFRSVHGPVVTQMANIGASEVKATIDLVCGAESESLFESCRVPGLAGISGPLMGGNVSVLAHLCGTVAAPELADSLCVLEDVGERPYALDRYLSQLLEQVDAARSLTSAAAVLLGDFERCEESKLAHSPDAVTTMLTRLQRASVPAAAGVPVGHGRRNWPFPMGAAASVDDDGRVCAEALCR